MTFIHDMSSRRVLIRSGTLELPPIYPGTTSEAECFIGPVNCIHDAELWLTVHCLLRYSRPWAETGHEITWFQTRLDTNRECERFIPPQLVATGGLQLRTTKPSWIISNDLFEVCFDRSSGGISSWKTGNKSILVTDERQVNAIIPSFWRAPTDNDKPRNNPYWKNFGVDTMTTQVRSVSIKQLSSGRWEIESQLFLSPPILDWGFETQMIYQITEDGLVQINTKLKPTGKKPSHLPRVGLNVRLARDIDHVRYFGSGPGEAYPDKRSSQRIGIYQSHIKDLGVNYEVPQENGNRMDARYVQLQDQRSGTCIDVMRSNGNFCWAVDRFTPDIIEQARHPCDLEEDSALTLRLDVAVAGVGTGACGPDVLEEHRVKCEDYDFQFELRTGSGAWFE